MNPKPRRLMLMTGGLEDDVISMSLLALNLVHTKIRRKSSKFTNFSFSKSFF